MKLIRNIPLRRAWYALILLASILPAVALSPWLGKQAHSLLLDRAMLREEMFHKQMETYLYLETERLVSVLQSKSDPIAYFISLNGHRKNIIDLMKKIDAREAVVNSTTIYDDQAHIVLSTQKGQHSIATVKSDSPAFVIPMHQRAFIGSPTRLIDQHYEFLIAVPLIHAGKTMGVIISTININAFWQNIQSRLPEHDSRAYLIDGRGSLLIHQDKSKLKQGILLSNKAIVRALLAHKDWHRSDSYDGFEGTKVFGIGTHVRGLQWGLVSEISTTKIMSPIVSALITLIIIVVVIHLLFGLIALMLSGLLINPVSELAAIMKRAASGDYSQRIKASGFNEIDALGGAFQSMLKQIDKRENMLKKLNRAIEQLGESVMITNRDGVIEYVNSAFSLMTGYGLNEVQGKNPNIVNSGTQPNSFYRKFWATIQSGEVWEGRLINRKKDGTLFPVLMSVAPIFESSEITHFVAVQQNMDTQDQLENQLRQSQKMEAIGTLVGGIAHDFNNMLAGMTGNLYLAKMKVPQGSDLSLKLDNIEQLSLRAAKMIQQLLTFARKGIVNMQAIQFSSFVKKILKFLSASVPENITLIEDICSDELPIIGDETQLHQMLMNLINNALDALEGVEDPVIRIRMETCRVDESMLGHDAFTVAGDYAHLSVSDNGTGIPKEHIEQLFDPFFTTKEQGKGTGLGLSMVFGSVKMHHGVIDVKSYVGEGATFHIYIPLQQNEVAEHSEIQHESVMGRNELILLVDDEPNVLQTTAEVLESLGYRVLQATDGFNALEVFKEHQDEIDLIISDVVMPHCGGIQLAERIRKACQDMPIIFMTGYDKEKIHGDIVITHNSVIISKPMQFDDLSRAIRTLLDENTATLSSQ